MFRRLLNADSTPSQFSRFLIVGGISTLVNYTVFAVLYFLGLGYLLASAIGYITGFVIGFIFNKQFTFKSNNTWHMEALKQTAVYALSLLLNLSVLYLLVTKLGLAPLVANIIAIGISTITNFISMKFFVFTKNKFELPNIFYSKLFITVLFIKIATAFFFGADVLINGFIPFVGYFVDSGFSDPYNYFFFNQLANAFPYPPFMLAILSIPRVAFAFLMQGSWQHVGLIEIFIAKLPLLLADITIFYVLCKLLEGKEKQVLYYYWLSPVLFYISYLEGQLDALPIALLFISIYFLYRNKLLYTFLFLGLAAATKTNIAAIVPVFLIYLWKRTHNISKILSHTIVLAATYLVFVLPFLISKGFIGMVINAPEQFRALDFAFNFNQLTIYLVPVIYLALLIKFGAFRYITKRALLMFIALVFTVFVTLVPPATGWYYWSLPFIAYFFTVENKFRPALFWLLNAVILSFVLLTPSSDVFQTLQIIHPPASTWPPLFTTISSVIGLEKAKLIVDLSFAMIFVLLGTIAWLIYQNGIRNKLINMQENTHITIGIAGNSGSGKTTLSKILEDLFQANALVIHGDDMHKWERGNKNWQIFTPLNPLANKLHEDVKQAIELKKGYRVGRQLYDHATGKFTEKTLLEPKKFIIFEGLHYFYIENMRKMLDLKIFLNPNPELVLHWKLIRDMKERRYSKAKVLQQIAKRRKDLQKHVNPQQEFADIIFSLQLINPIKKLGDENEKLNYDLNIECKNNIDLTTFAAVLQSISHLKIEIEPGLVKQRIKIQGEILSEQIKRAAEVLVPDYNEIILNDAQTWHSNYNGIVQLFITFYYQSILEVNSNEQNA